MEMHSAISKCISTGDALKKGRVTTYSIPRND
jgi:hypothetical protein